MKYIGKGNRPVQVQQEKIEEGEAFTLFKQTGCDTSLFFPLEEVITVFIFGSITIGLVNLDIELKRLNFFVNITQILYVKLSLVTSQKLHPTFEYQT